MSHGGEAPAATGDAPVLSLKAGKAIDMHIPLSLLLRAIKVIR